MMGIAIEIHAGRLRLLISLGLQPIGLAGKRSSGLEIRAGNPAGRRPSSNAGLKMNANAGKRLGAPEMRAGNPAGRRSNGLGIRGLAGKRASNNAGMKMIRVKMNSKRLIKLQNLSVGRAWP